MKKNESLLLLVSKGHRNRLGEYEAGAEIWRQFQQEIGELRKTTCRQRLQLASQTLACAKRMLKVSRPDHRSIVSRAYYAMYHSMRSVVYLVSKGDDHQDHSDLPKQIPDDFPDRDRILNMLKTARADRNAADYDPYPPGQAHLRQRAKEMVGEMFRRYSGKGHCSR